MMGIMVDSYQLDTPYGMHVKVGKGSGMGQTGASLDLFAVHFSRFLAASFSRFILHRGQHVT